MKINLEKLNLIGEKYFNFSPYWYSTDTLSAHDLNPHPIIKEGVSAIGLELIGDISKTYKYFFQIIAF